MSSSYRQTVGPPCIPAADFRNLIRRANQGEGEARAKVFRELNPEQQVRKLDEWRLPLEIDIDYLGDPILA